MNSFGRIFKINIFGTSHGDFIGAVIDGVPSGISLNEKSFEKDLKRRKAKNDFETPRREDDKVKIISGVFKGKTTGDPLTILIENKRKDSKVYEKNKNFPRPGHADFAKFIKTNGFYDYRGGGISSGRLTAVQVAAGVIAKKVLKKIKIKASVKNEKKILNLLETNPNDSVGGVIRCSIKGLNPGLGEPYFDSFESVLSHAMFSIPAIKGVTFGNIDSARELLGSKFNDEIISIDGRTKTNNSGGINGGITNGNDIAFNVFVRPASTIPQSQNTINLKTGKKVKRKFLGKHDRSFIFRMPVIVEAMSAIVTLDFILLSNAYKGL